MITSRLAERPFYSGSQLFLPLANKLDVPLDQINFLIAQLTALFLSYIYRVFVNPRVKSIETKYFLLFICGFLLGYFEFGYQIWNLLNLAIICYILILKCNTEIVQKLVLFLSIFYLSYLHLMRQINDYGNYVVEITVPLMIAVQKLSSLAFSIHDGSRKKSDLTLEQQHYAVYKSPNLLQFISYIFQFPTLLAGPMLFYNDFVKHVEKNFDEDHLKNDQHKLSSVKSIVFKKLTLCILFLVLLLFVQPMFPIDKLNDDEFLKETSYFGILGYIYISTLCSRFKYYHAWKLGEAIAITAGFGLILSDDNEKLNYICSVDIFEFEFANSFHTCLTSWNMTTQRWLRGILYERSKNLKVLKTYILSAVWHGFYPGYYLTFFSGALLTEASRVIRKFVRPIFQNNNSFKLLYDILTFLVTKIILAYIVFPFVILDFYLSYKIYSRLYFSGHLILILIVILGKTLLPKTIHNKQKTN